MIERKAKIRLGVYEEKAIIKAVNFFMRDAKYKLHMSKQEQINLEVAIFKLNKRLEVNKC